MVYRAWTGVVSLVILTGIGAISSADEDKFAIALKAEKFDQAIRAAETAPLGQRDEQLGRVAVVQARKGSHEDARSTLRRIKNPASLATASQNIASEAAGGATGADFDTLINLIETTVSPESWEAVGGPGTIASFPGGIEVDAQGILRSAARVDDQNIQRKRARIAKRLRADPASPHLDEDDSDLRFVSLTRLERELQLRAAFGEQPTRAMRHLAGLTSIQYVFVYPESGEFVIAGPAHKGAQAGRPPKDIEDLSNHQAPLLLEHLVTLLRSRDAKGGRFGCSIDPKRTRLAATQTLLAKTTERPLNPTQTPRWVDSVRETLGLQDIRVHGVNAESQIARILVEADYHMKLVGMGLQPSVPEVPSYLKSISIKTIPESMDILRWWFTLTPDAVSRNQAGDTFVLAPQIVRLQSENERLNERGGREHTGKSSALNAQFAERFTNHYDKLAAKYPVYARLENVFRLALVAAIIQDPAVQTKLNWRADWLQSHVRAPEGRVAREVPSVVNHRVLGGRHVILGVSGGVSVDSGHSLRKARSGSLSGLSTKVAQSAHPKTPRHSAQWWWNGDAIAP